MNAQLLSCYSPAPDSELPSEIQNASTTPIVSEDRKEPSNIQSSSDVSPNEQSIRPESSSTLSQEDRSIASDSQQKVFTSSQIQQSPINDENVQERSSSEGVDHENQLVEVAEEYDNVTKDEIVNDQHQSTQFIERSPTKIESNEEPISSSEQNQTEKENRTDYISSTGYYGTINDFISSIPQELSGQSSRQASLTDVEGGNTDLIEGSVS
jgi:hypothetical protein